MFYVGDRVMRKNSTMGTIYRVLGVGPSLNKVLIKSETSGREFTHLIKDLVPYYNEVGTATVKWKDVDFNKLKGDFSMKRTINKLNGLKLGEENLVELSQEASTSEVISLSLYSILKESSAIKNLGLGKEALLTGISIKGESLDLTVSHGNVEREENMALLNSIQELVKNKND